MKNIYKLLFCSLVSILSISPTFAQRVTTNSKQTQIEDKGIHETPNTKTFVVSDLHNLKIGDFHEGYVLVVEENTHDVHIFDSHGINTGNYRRNESYFNPSEVYVSDGIIVDQIEGDDYCIAAIDTSGRILFSESIYTTQFVDGIASRPSNFVHDAYYIDKQAKKVFPKEKSSVKLGSGLFPLSCDRRKVSIQTGTAPSTLFPGGKVKTYSYGYLDADFKMAIPAQYENATNFSEGLAAVCTSKGDQEYWGYIDVNGNTVIPPKFSNKPGYFHDGYAKVKKNNNRIVFIDKKGEVVSPEYLEAYDFCNGFAFVLVPNGRYSVKQLIDTSFKVLREDKYQLPRWISPRLNLYYEVGDYNTGDNVKNIETGDAVFNCKGFNIGKLDEGATWYISRKGAGLINAKGEIMVKFIESEF